MRNFLQYNAENVAVALVLVCGGLLFGALAVSLLLSGVLGELIYKTGDLRLSKLSALSAKSFSPASKSSDASAKPR